MNIRTHLLCFRLRYWSRQTNRYWFSASIHRQLKPTSVQWPLPSSASFSPPLIVIMLATASMLVPSLHLPLTNYSSSMARALRPLSLQKFNTPVHNPLSLYFFSIIFLSCEYFCLVDRHPGTWNWKQFPSRCLMRCAQCSPFGSIHFPTIILPIHIRGLPVTFHIAVG